MRGKRVLGFVGLAALVAVPVATAQLVIGSTVFRTVAVPSGQTAAARVTCAPGYLAVSGGVHAPAPGVATLGVHADRAARVRVPLRQPDGL